MPRIQLPGVALEPVDGDTLDIEIRFVVRVRLLAEDGVGCWAPEAHAQSSIADPKEREREKARGLAATEHLRELATGKACIIDLALLSNRLIDYRTLERTLSVVRLADGTSLGAQMIADKHASSTKSGKLGE